MTYNVGIAYRNHSGSCGLCMSGPRCRLGKKLWHQYRESMASLPRAKRAYDFDIRIDHGNS